MWMITALFSEVSWKYKNYSQRPEFSKQPNISEIGGGKKEKKKKAMREVESVVLTDSYKISEGTIPSHIY